MIKYCIHGCLLILVLSSCKTMYPNRMFQTKNDDLITDTVKVDRDDEYVISVADKLGMQVFSNNGFEIVSVLSTKGPGSGPKFEYLVKNNGFVKLPVIDSFYIAGLTVSRAEDRLQEIYEKYFNDPFVTINVTNRRVSVYLGSNASIVLLKNENTTLIEVLAEVGGMSSAGKAYRVKVISGSLKNPEIRVIDLSTIEGIRQADLTIRANDIIYVERSLRFTSDVLREITPIIGILTSFLLVIDIVTNRR